MDGRSLVLDCGGILMKRLVDIVLGRWGTVRVSTLSPSQARCLELAGNYDRGDCDASRKLN